MPVMPDHSSRRAHFVPLVIALLLALIKAAHIAGARDSADAFALGMILVRNDLPLLGFIGFFSTARILMSAKPFQILCEFFTMAGVVWYFIDTAIILALNSRVPLTDLVAFLKEMRSAPDIAWLFVFSVSIVGLLIYARRFEAPLGKAPLVAFGFFLLQLVPTFDPEQGLKKYATPILIGRTNRNILALPAPWFSDAELRARGAAESRFQQVEFAGGQQPNIIVVVIESLSSADSLRASGLGNLVPKFDQMSKDGMLFTNFYANYCATEGGLISLFYGHLPLQFPGNSWTIYDSYTQQDSIVQRYRMAGYHAQFLTTSSLGFRHKGNLISQAGFQTVLGLAEVPEFADAERFAFHSPTDAVLYERAIKDVRDLQATKKPYLLAVETVSSHLPYVSPFGPPHTEARVWEYVDEQLYLFYQRLARTDFFNNGILVVTGDHRKMLPIPAAEEKLYGASAEARVPLLVIGTGIPKNVVDTRLFQQVDLLQQLPHITDQERELSPYTTFVTYYHMPLIGSNKQTSIVFVSAETKPEAYYLDSHGKNNEWIYRPPGLLGEVITRDRERLIAHFQYCNQHPGSCNRY